MIYINKFGVFVWFVATINIVFLFKNNTTPEFKNKCCIDKFEFHTNKVINELKILKNLDGSFSSIKQTLNIFVRLFNELESSVPDPMTKSDYLENASNTFALVRRISNLWPPILSLMKIAFGNLIKNPVLGSFVSFIAEEIIFVTDFLDNSGPAYLYYPINTTITWRSALTGLVRLQETYDLSTADLAAGVTPGGSRSFNNTALSAADCYDIGVYCIKAGVAVRAVEWIVQASLRAGNDPGVSIRGIKEYLQVAFCYTGDEMRYSETLLSLLEDTSFAPTNDLYNQYGNMITHGCKILKYFHVDNPIGEMRRDQQGYVPERKLCRKNSPGLIPTDKNLKCRMIHYNQFYLRIGPLKMEELNIDPPVLIFHQVANENELEDLIKDSHDKTRPAVLDYGRGYTKYDDTQYNHWLLMWNSNLTMKWNRKSKMIANVRLRYSIWPMVASYGLAAEICLHKDLGPDVRIFKKYSRGDYITLMFWLNEPGEGGFTIFPDLNLSVAPVKGSAILWFNRLPNWYRDLRAYHAGCPVLAGTKWVLTKWFHVLNQDFPKCVPGKERTRQYYYLESNIIE